MDEDLAVRLLVDLLSEIREEKGARLSTNLRRAFELRTGRVLDWSRLGYAKFRGFLDAHSDVVRVSPDPSSTDILVQLKSTATDVATAPVGAEQSSTVAPRRLPAPVWQAFTNPDPTRRRFFNRNTGEVEHYSEEFRTPHDLKALEQVKAWGDQAVEIPRIPAEEQHSWMYEFVHSLSIAEHFKAGLERVLNTTYTSKLNAVLEEALGDHASRWRTERQGRVYARVVQWCQEVGVSLERLHAVGRPRSAAFLERVKPLSASPAHDHSRHRLERVLAELTDEDLSEVWVPLRVVARILDRSSS